VPPPSAQSRQIRQVDKNQFIGIGKAQTIHIQIARNPAHLWHKQTIMVLVHLAGSESILKAPDLAQRTHAQAISTHSHAHTSVECRVVVRDRINKTWTDMLYHGAKKLRDF
jgi:hypothetical protein